MNFKHLGVREMNAKEKISLNGGISIPKWGWQGALVAFVYNVFADWDENVGVFNQGRNDLLN